MEKLINKINNILDDVYPEKLNLKELENNTFFIWKKKYFFYYLKPVKNPFLVKFDDLLCMDNLKKNIYDNTLQFLNGYRANNVLLWGEKGCGKSSLVKSLVPLFDNFKLKLIEVGKEDFYSLEELIELLTGLSYKFIIFLDDVSFVEEDKNFKTLKAILDGSLVEYSDNYVIYATSNRRHFIKESFEDNDEIHIFESISEKISLSDRFGISWGFYKPDKESYLKIAKHYSVKFGLKKYFTEKSALQFALGKGGFSGRAAYQYAVSLFKNKI